MKQGTIKTYDPKTRSGVLLDDQKNEFSYDADSIRGSGLRELRIGQRVKFDVQGEGDRMKIRDLTIVTL